MARDRRGAQLCVAVPPELLEQVRQEADRQQRRISTLVCEWIRAGLSAGPAVPAGGSDGFELQARLEALEQAMAALANPSSPDRVINSPPGGGSPVRQQLELAPLEGSAITTAELAARTGSNRAAWNNWARADRIGQVRQHQQAGSWRLAGKAAPESGGPARWLWEPA